MEKPFPILKKDSSEEFYKFLDEFINAVHDSVSALKDTMHHYCNGSLKKVRESADKVIELEKKADAIRRRMEKDLYKGVLLPFGREDKYALVEELDDIADKAEIIVRLADIERPKIPNHLKDNIKGLANLVEGTSDKLKRSVLSLNIDIKSAIDSANTVELHREKVRALEFKILEKVLVKKNVNSLILKELVTLVSQVADKTEEAADRVITLAVKYQG